MPIGVMNMFVLMLSLSLLPFTAVSATLNSSSFGGDQGFREQSFFIG